MTRYDLLRLFDWCESGDFWQRFIIAASAYPAEIQMKMVRFAVLYGGGDDEISTNRI